MTIKSQLPGLPPERGQGQPPRPHSSSVVVEIDAGRRAAARTRTQHRSGPPRAAAQSPHRSGEHAAAFTRELQQARKNYDEGSPAVALFHLRMAARLLDGELMGATS